MQSKIIIGLVLIDAFLLVEVFFPKKSELQTDLASLKEVKNSAPKFESKKVLPVDNETVIQITTKTGRKKNAGTDSKVGLYINGDKKSYTRLDNIKINDYKTGASNSYTLIANSSIKNLNSLSLIIDGHDAWFLEKISVRLFSYSHQTQIEQQFDVNRWFSSEQKDMKAVDAVPSMIIDLKNKRLRFYSRITPTKPTSTKSTSTKPTSTKPTSTKPTSTKSTSTKSTSTKPTPTKTPPPQTKQKPFSKVDAKSKFSGQGNLSLNIDEMALIENESYKVLIDFTKISHPDRSTEYRCRFFNKKTKGAAILKGSLVEKYERVKKENGKTYLKDMGSVLDIKFKDTKIRWSYGGYRGGWLYLKSWDSIDVLDQKDFDSYKLN